MPFNYLRQGEIKNMNSFIPWIGGKKLLRKKIIAEFPKEGEFERYIEVFGGAGWVLFAKEAGKHLEVFNDIDSNLINLYRCIKYHCEELQKELDWLCISREQFFDSKEQLNTKGMTDIQRAARYFLVIKISFGADRRSFGTKSTNLINIIEDLIEVKNRLRKVVIENNNYDKLIKTYDREKALFYLDPPYVEAETYYNCNFSMDDHEKLNTILKGIKGKFILSYNDNEYIRELYKDFNVIAIDRNSNLLTKSKPCRYKELIIKNY